MEFEESKILDWDRQEEVKKTFVILLDDIQVSREQTVAISSPDFLQNDDHDSNEKKKKKSEPPRKMQVHG